MEDVRLYAYCTVCNHVVKRIPGYRHGDGQVDSDKHPVWLLSDAREITADHIATLPSINCGCND